MKNHRYAIIGIVLAVLLMAGTFGIHPAKAETLDFGWVQGGGGTNLDYGTAIALDDGGNVFTTGFVTNGPGNQDGFLQKWDASGNPIWAKFVAGPGNDTDHAVALDGDGNVYVAGTYSNTVEFNPGNSDYDLTSAGLTDIFVIKYDADGNFIWVKSVGGISSDGGYGITIDGDGNVYVTGIYIDRVDFDPGGGVSTLTSAGAEDIFVLKLDRDGNFLWAKSMGGPGSDYSFDVVVDVSGNVFTTGYFNDTADFDPGAGTSNLTSLGQGDFFISKLDSSGDYVWAQRMGAGSFDAGIEIAADGDGNIFTVGYLDVGKSHDVFLGKWDGNGYPLWAHVIGGESYDTGYGIALDGSGNVYYTGDFSGTVDFDPGAGTSNLTSAGDSDIFISKLDSGGNFVWAKNLGGTSADSGEGIAVQNDGNLYLIGTFSDTVDFELGTGTSMLTSAGSLDIFIARLNLTPQIHYVKWDATGANNGISWEDAYTDLQFALAAASYGDEIWVAAGTYKPTSGTDRTISFVLKNGVGVYGGFAGTETSRDQRNYETYSTILSGDIGMDNNNSDNSYHVVSSEATGNATVLDGFTITAGNANGSYPYNKGGGMLSHDSSPALTNVTFNANRASASGGGMRNERSNPTLKNVSFSDNSATGGGAMDNSWSNPILTNVTFNANTAGAAGGGMLNDSSNPILTDVTFSSNSATGGGGMINFWSNPILTNVTFNANSASASGGGMRNEQSNPTLTNATFSENSATYYAGGGIYNESNSHVTMRNTILWGNTAPSGAQIYNDNTSVSNVSDSVVQGGLVGGTNIITADPLLGSLGDFGGFTETIPLQPGSSAIDTGDDANCPDTDQRGVTRPQGSHCDIGAFEAVLPLIVTNTADGGPGSLRQAVLDAEEGETITFAAYLAGQAIPFNSPLIIDKDLTIDASALNLPLTLLGGPYTRIMEVKYPAKVTISRLVLTGGTATSGNGGAVYVESEFTAINSTFSDNKAIHGGAIWGGRITLINSTLTRNIAAYDGGAVGGVILDIRNTTIQSNEAYHDGGGMAIYGDGSARVANSTIFGNQAGNHGGGFFATGETLLDVRNSTFAENTAANGDEFMLGETRQVDFINTIFVCNADSDKCYMPAGNAISSTNSILGTGTLQDYGLSEPADNGGPTHTMALFPGSPLIDAGDDTLCAGSPVNNLDQRGVARPQGAHCDIGAYEYKNGESMIHVAIGKADPVSYPAVPHESQQKSYAGVNDGPVRITHTNNLPILAAERLIYKVNNVPVSFSEMMALPASQLDKVYWLPWYNNNGKDLDTQLRFGNVSETETATVSVFIGDDEMESCTSIPAIAYPYELKPGESVRVSCAGVNAGPVQIQSDVNIVAAERLIYKVNNVATSFTEMMALPGKQLDNVHWLPWYNNVGLDTQLRIGNVNELEQATVHLFIGDDEISTCTSTPPMTYPYELDPGQSVRVSCPGLNAGPLRIESTQNIVAAERLIYKVNNSATSFNEMMALPESQLHDTYWLPWYNNFGLDTQLRIGNVSGTEQAEVHLYLGENELSTCTSIPPMTYPYELDPGESVRVSCPNLSAGPIKIASDIPVVAAARVIYKVNGVNTSFSEMMALPDALLDTSFWLPWYNNSGNLDTQLRFGMP